MLPIVLQNHLASLLTVIVTKLYNLSLPKEELESFIKAKFGDKAFFTRMVVDCSDYTGFICLNPVYDILFLAPINIKTIENRLPSIKF